MVLVCTSISEADDTSHFGIKFGVSKSHLDITYDGEPMERQNAYPKLGPVFGVYHHGSFADVPVDATLTYRQEGGADKMHWNTVMEPEGTGEYAMLDTNYDLIDLSLTARPGIRVGDFGYSVVAGGGASLVLGAHGAFTEATSFNRFVFAYTYGIEIRYHRPADWMPFIEILSRTEFTDIYEHEALSGPSNPSSHRIDSVSVLVGFALGM